MKKVFVIGVLLGVMLLARSLGAADGGGAVTLAAIGFVVLAAYAVAELGQSMSLPAVTGYILAGVALGPAAGRIISGDVVSEMRMFNTLALGLIAIRAGLELDARQVLRLGKTLALTTAVKITLGVALVALTFMGVETALGSLGLAGQREMLAMALVLGVLSLGTSPSVVLAVLSETRARGRLSDLVLGAAVFKDLVVVVALAVATAVSRTLIQPGATLDIGLLSAVASELLGSILGGAIVGGIFIAYMRFVGAEMLLFVAAMILVVAEACRAFHLELLLVFITAGFVVRNLSELEHRLAQPLELVALPVFVVFFTNAGASIDLESMGKILPLALALCAARALGYIVASRWAGKWAGESVVVQRRAWLAYLPQAGVTLGLVGVTAPRLPSLATPITVTGMAVVAINLLLGPIALRRALGLANELPVAEGAPKGAAAPSGEAAQQPPAGRAAESPVPGAAHASSLPVAGPDSVERLPKSLRWAHERLRVSLADVLARFQRDSAPGLPALPPLDGAPDATAFRAIVSAHRAAYQGLYADLSGLLGELPVWYDVPAEEAGSARRVWRRRRSRRLPLRRIARIALEPPMAAHVARLFEDGLRQRVGQAAPAPTVELAVSAEPAAPAAPLPAELAAGLLQFARLLLAAGTPRMPVRKLRYSDVEPEIRRQLQGLAGATEADLARVARAAWAGRQLERQVAGTMAQLQGVIHQHVVEPGREAGRRLGPALGALASWLEREQVELSSRELAAADLERSRLRFEQEVRAVLGELSRDFRVSTTLRAASNALDGSIQTLPASVECLYLEPGAPLHHGRAGTVALRARAEALVRQLTPAVDVAVRSLANAFARVPTRIAAAVAADWSFIEARTETGRTFAAGELPADCLAGASQRVKRVARLTARAIDDALAGLEAAVQAAEAAFREDVIPHGAAQARRRTALLQRPLLWGRDLARRGRDFARALANRQARPWDAASVRNELAGKQRALPVAVQHWFSDGPVTDERIFAAHRALLEVIVDADALCAEGGIASVLILGPKGSGKSSLLNTCELESRGGRLLRLHAEDFGRETSLLQALANLLESPPTRSGVARHILLERPAIFVDDLETWVSSALDREAELLAVLQLIAETRAAAFWVVTLDSSMAQLFGELVNVQEVFTNVVSLPPLTLAEVRHLVESRLEHAHVDVTFQPTRLGRVLDELRVSSVADRVYRSLLAVSGGNPGRVVAICRGAFEHQDERLILREDEVRPRPALRFELSVQQLGLLAALHRYGSLSPQQLQRELGAPVQELERSAAFLAACGLVIEQEDGGTFSIAAPARWAAVSALQSARLLPRSSA